MFFKVRKFREWRHHYRFPGTIDSLAEHPFRLTDRFIFNYYNLFFTNKVKEKLPHIVLY